MVVEESSGKMEMKGQELGYVCKYCTKKFSCGKSLGGHIRSHVVSNSAESEQKAEASMKKISSFGVAGQQSITIRESKHAEFGSGHSVYGLRENPKKTWRAVFSTLPVLKEKVCKECGKGFPSVKALCGHMASHSEDRDLKDDDDSRTSENQKVELDSDSETEVEDMSLRTRAAKNKRYKKIVEKSSPFSFANNGSSSVSEIVGPEEVEAAMLLLMLKKDPWGNKGGVNSVEESSENTYSVVLEAKSSSNEVGMGKDSSLCAEIATMENSVSGYVLAGCSKAVYLYGLPRYGTFGECKKPFKIVEGKVEECSAAVGKRKYSSEKMMKNGTPNATSEKKSYECLNCKKTFESFHALGGHKPCQKRGNAYYESGYESSENTLDDSIDYTATGKLVGSSSNTKSRAKNYAEEKVKPKKKKGLVCPICNRVFKNGLALGGHKKTHRVGGNKGNSSQSSEVKPEVPDKDVPFPFDLNLPAPEAVEDEGNGQFFP